MLHCTQWRRKMFLSRGAESKQVKTCFTHAYSAQKLGGSGGMLPQENFGVLDLLRAFLVHFRGYSELLACHVNTDQ